MYRVYQLYYIRRAPWLCVYDICHYTTKSMIDQEAELPPPPRRLPARAACVCVCVCMQTGVYLPVPRKDVRQMRSSRRSFVHCFGGSPPPPWDLVHHLAAASSSDHV